MKKITTLLLTSLLMCMFAKAQYVDIPDSNFRAWIQGVWPAGFNAAGQMDTTYSGFVGSTVIPLSPNYVHPNPKPIHDLTGIQYFKSLINLEINYCRIDIIPAFPPSLATIILDYDSLTYLPKLPLGLKTLELKNSNLTCLPEIPNSLTRLLLDSNITCLPNYTANINFASNGLPLCTTPSPCALNNPYVNIPDSNFAKYLITKVPSCLYKDSANKYWMDTTCNGVLNMTLFGNGYVVRNTNPIHDLTGIKYFKSLRNLQINFCRIDAIPELPDSINYLHLDSDSLTQLQKLPSSLKSLYLNKNQLTELPALPASLTLLECGNNNLTKLPTLPDSINNIQCPFNQIASLPLLPNSLSQLGCGYNKLTSLPTLPNLLTILGAQYNSISALPSIPSNVNTISISNNNLTLLPTLNAALSFLDCSNNKINALPTLPSLLGALKCNGNNLTSLPALPNTINYINCSDNPLFSLPTLPTSLNSLYCLNNRLSSLPTLPKALVFLNVSQNPITILPTLDKNLQSIYCQSDTNLTCLPTLPDTLSQLVLDSVTQIHCLPNYTSNITFTSTGLPLCTSSCIAGNPYVNIPDSNFAKYLITQVPSCLYKDSANKYWMDTTCSGIDTLKVISCGNMNISDLTGVSYFKNLDTLNCNNNLLTSLPPIANTIKVLFASYNQLTSLPTALPDSLRTFLCNNNKLTSLPTIPVYVNYLSCEYNQLSSLPHIPDSVGLFLCQNNQLTSIPNIPSSIGIFTCDNNQLTSLPPFPATDSTKGHNFFFSATGNKNLTCLPKLPDNFRAVHLDSTEVTCLPDTLTYAVITPVGLPVCSGGNPCGVGANYVNIPDYNFANYLITQVPSCLYKDSNNKYWMDTTCSGVLNTDSMFCSHASIKDLTGIQYFKSLTYLNCSNDSLTFLPTLPTNLKTLDCSINNLTILPILPNSLDTLICYSDELTALLDLPQSLKQIICSGNNLTRLPNLPRSLIYLDCRSNNLTALPTLPDSLQYLICSSNKLDTLPSNLPGTLVSLECEDDGLTYLPKLPDGISLLRCGYQKLTSLPTLPKSISTLMCGYNQITSLPALHLWILYCNNNQLTSMPDLPFYLSELDCSNNKLVSLPQLDQLLGVLACSNNMISSLPTLDTLRSLRYLYCDGNTSLQCLPKLPNRLDSLNVTGTGIHCLPNYTSKVNFASTGLPLCNPTNNVNQCKAYPTVMGKVFVDINKNGIKDSDEYYIPLVPVSLNTGTIAYTNNDGQYDLSTNDTGSFSLTVTAPRFYKAVPETTNFSFTANNSLLTLADIALQPTDLVDSLDVNVYNWQNAVPGRPFAYSVAYRNLGTVPEPVNVAFSFDTTKLQFDSTTIPNATVNGNTIVWTDTIQPDYFNGNFSRNGYNYPNIFFKVLPSAHFGDSLNASAFIIAPKTADSALNSLVIKGSYDPNSKEATPQLTTTQVANGQGVDYRIHFQNVGNAIAKNVVIADTLSSLLTQGILQITGKSFNPDISLDHNVLYFQFRNINLVDSGTNQLMSNGFINFRVTPIASVTEGTVINNTASVYFDYNSPTVTNTASTLIKDNPLPVSFVSYQAHQVGNKQQIENDWSTANELNTVYYNVQRSTDGIHFSTIGKVTARGFGAGSYHFIDNTPKDGMNYYRLQSMDRNGTSLFSSVVSVSFTVYELPFTISPNPAREVITLKGSHIASVQVIDNLGRVVRNETMLDATNPTLSVINLSAGVYHLKVQTTDGNITGVGFVKE